jgi:UPF0042 nucleotide-binding protein
MDKKLKKRIIIVTGLSGAGKSVALRALEDSGYFCIDNFPLPLLRNFITMSSETQNMKDIGLSIDVREKELLKNAEDIIFEMKKNHHVEVVFLEAEPSVLIRRFKETRRPHPLSEQTGESVEDALRLETEYLSTLRNIADRVIDTSSFTPHQLRSLITEIYGATGKKRFTIMLISFGYKFGIPQNIDLLFDVRFLKNPHFVPELRVHTGLEQSVLNYIKSDPRTDELLEHLRKLLAFLIKEYITEGKSSVNIGIGCTGGRHRSVAIVEEIKKYLSNELGLDVQVIHREL